MPAAPFIYHHYKAFTAFCLSSDTSLPPWCQRFPPLIYPYVQRKYWDVGLFRYWTVQQIPNFVISIPVFALLVYGIHLILANRSFKQLSSMQASQAKLIPHAIYTGIFTMLVLFNSHVQIILRLSTSIPLLYWAAAWLLIQKSWLAKVWISWSMIWGALSTVLWGAFLPPA